MGGLDESKDGLIRAIMKQEKDLSRIKGQVEANDKKVAELKGKIAMVQEVVKLYTDAIDAQPSVDKDVDSLQQLLLRVEALAESENARCSQNEQVRQINEQIGKAVEELSGLEQRLRQIEGERKDVETHLESVQFEFNNRAGGAAIRLEQAYKAIQDTRQEIANVRRQNLQTFLDREDRLARAEVENQGLMANSLLYRQLTSSLQLELQVLNDDAKQPMLQREVEKFDQAIAGIPQRQPLPPDVRLAEEQACTGMLQEIHAATEEVKVTIAKMAAAEKETDTLNGEMRKGQDTHERLRRQLTELDEKIEAMQREYDDLKEQEGSSAAREIQKLDAEIRDLERETEEMHKRLEGLQRAKSGTAEIPPSMLKLIAGIRADGQRLDESMESLLAERQELEAGNQKLRAQLEQMQQETAFERHQLA